MVTRRRRRGFNVRSDNERPAPTMPTSVKSHRSSPAPTEPVTRVTEPEPTEAVPHGTEPEPTLTTEEASQLAADLVRELADHAGDPAAVRATMLRWLDDQDVSGLSLVCMAAVQLTFADCLRPVPVDQIPAGSLTLTPPERTP
jgi:hypothetical protein